MQVTVAVVPLPAIVAMFAKIGHVQGDGHGITLGYA
jgi:hypothetical protein